MDDPQAQGRPGLFLLLLAGLSAVAYAVIHQGGGLAGRHIGLLLPALMWVPGLCALVVLRREGRPIGGVGWKLGDWRYATAALLLPPLAHVAAMSALVLLGAGSLPARLVEVRDGLVHARPGVRLLLGAGARPLPAFLANYSLSVLVMALIVAPINAAFTLGEELGWRGYLQPRLIARWGTPIGLTLTGLIWGYWHFPVIWMGYNFPAYPRLGALVLMPLLCLGFAGFLGWLYLRSGSIWAPALAHATINASGGVLDLDAGAGARLAIDGTMIGLWLAAGFLCAGALSRSSPAAASAGGIR